MSYDQQNDVPNEVTATTDQQQASEPLNEESWVAKVFRGAQKAAEGARQYNSEGLRMPSKLALSLENSGALPQFRTSC
jgi:hypothetical protein